MKTRPEDYVAIVRQNARLTTAYLLAYADPCLEIARQDAEATKGRTFVVLTSPPDRPPASWAMAVILCPGDSTEDVALFVRGRPHGERERIQFYQGGPIDDQVTFHAWTRQGLLPPTIVKVQNWRHLHQHYGAFVNDWIYHDATRPPQA